MRHDKTTERGPDDGTDLENAVVPGHRVRERVARDERWKKRAARRPGKRARNRAQKEQQIDQRNGSVIEVKSALMSFEDVRDGSERVIA